MYRRIALMSFLCRFPPWAFAWRWGRCCYLLVAVRWQGGDTEYPLADLPIKLVLGVAHFFRASDVVEKQLYLIPPEPWWHLTMWGSRPFMIIPHTKRPPNNTKMDQLPIFRVTTGLPRPYLNTSPPWWVAYAEIWGIRGDPGSTN